MGKFKEGEKKKMIEWKKKLEEWIEKAQVWPQKINKKSIGYGMPSINVKQVIDIMKATECMYFTIHILDIDRKSEFYTRVREDERYEKHNDIEKRRYLDISFDTSWNEELEELIECLLKSELDIIRVFCQKKDAPGRSYEELFYDIEVIEFDIEIYENAFYLFCEKDIYINLEPQVRRIIFDE